MASIEEAKASSGGSGETADVVDEKHHDEELLEI